MSEVTRWALFALGASPGLYALLRWRWPHFHRHDRYPSKKTAAL